MTAFTALLHNVNSLFTRLYKWLQLYWLLLQNMYKSSGLLQFELLTALIRAWALKTTPQEVKVGVQALLVQNNCRSISDNK